MSSFEEQDEALSREEVLRELEAKNDFVFDPETAPKIEHNWTARGIRFVCWGCTVLTTTVQSPSRPLGQRNF